MAPATSSRVFCLELGYLVAQNQEPLARSPFRDGFR